LYKFANLPGQEKRDYFVATGDKTDTPLPPYLIEKDFWVCFLLSNLDQIEPPVRHLRTIIPF